MRVRLHAPAMPEAPQGWGMAERARLLEVCRRAQARAVAEVQRWGITVELVPAHPIRGRTEAGEAAPFAMREARERMAADRYREGPAMARYDVPSYNAEGAPTPVTLEDEPLVFADEHVGRTKSYEIGGDMLFLAPLGRLPVLMIAADNFRFAESPRYVYAASLRRARKWGAALFGAAGYVVLTAQSAPGVFIVAGLDAPLRQDDVPDVPGKPELKIGRIIDPKGYDTVEVVTAEEVVLTPTNPAARWTPAAIAAELARPTRPLGAADLQLAAEIIAGESSQHDRPEATADALVLMDADLFRAVPWTERVKYLELLARLGLDAARRSAVIAIVKSCSTTSELDAMVGEVRAAGLYELLFEEIDEEIYQFLQALADYAPPVALDGAYLTTLFLDQLGLKAPPRAGEGQEAPSALDELSLACEGIRGWVVGTVKSFGFMLSRPDKVLEGLGQLAMLMVTCEKARIGDQAAQSELATLARAASHGICKAIRGMELAEELGRPYAGRGGHSQVGHAVLTRLHYALMAEVLSWCVGIGEAKAAAVALPKAFGALAGLLHAIVAGGRLASKAERLERVLVLFATLSKLGEASRVARLVAMLPASELARLEHIVATAALRRMDVAELAAVKSLSSLHEAMGGKVPLRDLSRMRRALEAADRLEAKAAAAGLASEAALPGFHALMDNLPWRGEQLVRIVEAVPLERLAEFLHVMPFVRPEHFAALGTDFFRLVSGHPETLRLLAEAGGGIVVNLHRSRGSFHLLDELARTLARRRAEFGDPVAYRRFLDRVAQGDAEAVALATPERFASPQDVAAWQRAFNKAFPEVETAVEGASATAQLTLVGAVKEAIAELEAELGGRKLSQRDYGTALHTIVGNKVREYNLPSDYRLFVEQKMATITGMPADKARMTVAEFLSRNPHIERTFKVPPGDLLTRIGGLTPDLVLKEPGGGIVLWDLTSRERTQHTAKTLLYAAVLDEFGAVGGKARIGETLWSEIKDDLAKPKGTGR